MAFPFLAEDDSVVDIGFKPARLNIKLLTKCRNVAGEFFIPFGITLYWYSLSGVTNAEISFAMSVCGIFQNRLSRLKFRNIFWIVQCYWCSHRFEEWEMFPFLWHNLTYGSLYTCKMPHQVLVQECKRSPFTLTRFYKVIIQQILNLFSENLLFYRVHSVWMLFHRFWTISKFNIMLSFVSFVWNNQK